MNSIAALAHAMSVTVQPLVSVMESATRMQYSNEIIAKPRIIETVSTVKY